jgi:hypothetical protein
VVIVGLVGNKLLRRGEGVKITFCCGNCGLGWQQIIVARNVNTITLGAGSFSVAAREFQLVNSWYRMVYGRDMGY